MTLDDERQKPSNFAYDRVTCIIQVRRPPIAGGRFAWALKIGYKPRVRKNVKSYTSTQGDLPCRTLSIYDRSAQKSTCKRLKAETDFRITTKQQGLFDNSSYGLVTYVE